MVSLVAAIASTFVLSAGPLSETTMIPADVKQAVKARAYEHEIRVRWAVPTAGSTTCAIR